MSKSKAKSKVKSGSEKKPEFRSKADSQSLTPFAQKGPRVVQVPATDPGAFNPNRPAGKLLQSQTAHLREALIKHMHEVAALTATDIRSLKTEGDVSGYIQKATAILHPHGAQGKKSNTGK
jgi:hypothetical protein